jgi:hypothetical protein
MLPALYQLLAVALLDVIQFAALDVGMQSLDLGHQFEFKPFGATAIACGEHRNLEIFAFLDEVFFAEASEFSSLNLFVDDLAQLRSEPSQLPVIQIRAVSLILRILVLPLPVRVPFQRLDVDQVIYFKTAFQLLVENHAIDKILIDEDCVRCIQFVLRPIVKQWRAPNIFVASATMPPLEIIKYAFPVCDIIDDETSQYEVALPKRTKLIMIVNAPVAKHKTLKKTIPRELRRFITRKMLEHGVRPKPDGEGPAILVGVQKHVEARFEEMKPPLPKHCIVRHFGGVAGLNDFSNVDLMISMGMAMVSPKDLEDQVAAITGRDPERLPEKAWLKRARGTIRLRNGKSVNVKCFMHPDPLVEMWRRHKYTSSIIQMIGRSRLYNRNEDTPLVIYVLSNEPLGITVDDVIDWTVRSKAMSITEPMACDGYVVLAPTMMSVLWPEVFSQRTAEREVEELRKGADKAAQDIQAILSGWRKFKVQKPGARQRWQEGRYDPARFSGAEGLRNALEAVLGPSLKLDEA